MMKPSMFGLGLIAVGVLFLLDQMGIARNLFSAQILWPIVWIVLGLSGIRTWGRRKVPWWSLFFLVYGVLLLLKNTAVLTVLSGVSASNLFWALALVFLGLTFVMPGRLGWPIVIVHHKKKDRRDKHVEHLDVKEIRETWTGWKRKHTSHTRRLIGDVSLGAHPWVLKDMAVWNGIGDVRVNLATAHVEDGEFHLDIGGLIGDVRVLVPQTLKVRVSSELKIGDVQLFGDVQSGLGRSVQYEDVGFEHAEKKVHIHVELLVGDIQVVRV